LITRLKEKQQASVPMERKDEEAMKPKIYALI
jgi:hypothetical protein